MKFKRALKYLFFILFLIGLGFLYSFSSSKNLRKKVAKISIEFEKSEHQFLTHSMVNKLLIQKKDSLQNKAKSVIDLYSLESLVTKNPFVEKANVFLTIEGELKSTIKQRNPIARIISNKESYYVDKQGVKVPLSDNYSARVLLVSGVETTKDLQKIMPLLIKIEGNNFWKKEIVGIKKSSANDYEFSVRSGDYKIDFGKLKDINIKFKKLKAFYNKTFEDESIQNYKTINLKYHNQVVCTK